MTDAAHRHSMKNKNISSQDRALITGYTMLAAALIGGILRAFTVGPILDGSLLLVLLVFAGGFALITRDSIATAKTNPDFDYDYDEEPSWQPR